MKFSHGSEVVYETSTSKHYGIIDFIDHNYIILKTPAAQGRSSPRIVVFPSDYNKVIVLKDSDK